jgi:hypothetical protein
VAVAVGILVEACVGVAVAVGIVVGVDVAVDVDVGAAVPVNVGDAVLVEVEVGVGVAVGSVCVSMRRYGLLAAMASRLARLRAVPLAVVIAMLYVPLPVIIEVISTLVHCPLVTGPDTPTTVPKGGALLKLMDDSLQPFVTLRTS